MDDASLDEFLDETADDSGGAADGVSDADGAGDGDETDGADGAVDTDDADGGAADSTDSEPIDADSTRSTYAWDPEGVACADCGAVVERRWRDGDQLVCTECKAW